MESLTLAASVLLGGVFGFAAVAKLVKSGSRDVSTLLEQAKLARGTRARSMAAALPAAELAVPLLLAVPPTRTAGFALAAGLSTGFAVVLALVLRREVRIACACFGAGRAPIGPLHVVRNAFLALVAAAGIAARDGAPADAPTIAVALSISLLATTLFLIWDDVVPALVGHNTTSGRTQP